MEWNTLGDLLGRSLSGGLNAYGDIALQKKAQQQEFDQRKQMMLEQESARQRALQAKQSEQERKAQMFADLISGRSPFQDQGIPNQGQMPEMPDIQGVQNSQQGIQERPNERLGIEDKISAAVQAGLSPQEISQIQRADEREKANKLKKEEFDYKKQQDIINKLEREQIRKDEIKNKQDLMQLNGINKIVAENYTQLPVLREKRNLYRDLVNLPKDPNLRQGKWRQTLDEIGMGDLWQSPMSDVTEKLINRIIVTESQAMSGATANTIQGLKNIKASVPNLSQNPEAFDAIALANSYISEAQYIESKELNKLANENGVNKKTLAERDKITKPKTKELHKKANYAIKLAAFPVDTKSAMKYQPDVELLYELPPVQDVPEGKTGVDKTSGVEFTRIGNKWVFGNKKGK